MTMQGRRAVVRIVAGAALLAVAGTIGHAAAQDRPAASMRAAAVQRTTLVVSDIEKSVDFYQRLGLVKWSDTTTADTDAGGVVGAADLPLTADPKRGRLVVLRGGDERTGLLALLWYDRPPLPSARGNLVGIGAGDVLIGLEVADIQGAYGRLNQIGVRFHRQPSRFMGTGADGGAVSGQQFLAYDPDGHMVQVTQTDAARR